MHEVTLLLGGLLTGLVLAAPIGPVNVLCIRRTLAGGWKSGVICGIGAAAADMLYGGVAGFGITLVVEFLEQERFWIRIFGGILLLGIGISYFFKRPKPRADRQVDVATKLADMRGTFFLALTNPTTILSFLAVLAALGMAQQRPWWQTLFLIAGIFCGSMAWWIILSSVVDRFRDAFRRSAMRTVNRVAGVAIGVFGIVTFLLAGAKPH